MALLAAQRAGNGEAQAAFCAAAGKHFAAVGGRHAFAETMFVDSLAVGGLVGSFHLCMVFIFLFSTSL